MKISLIFVALAFVAGLITNEHVGSDSSSHTLHQIETAAQTVQQDHVALERHLQSRERRDQMMFALFERVIQLIETDSQVAQHDK